MNTQELHDGEFKFQSNQSGGVRCLQETMALSFA
jgi:hypothetical protein